MHFRIALVACAICFAGAAPIVAQAPSPLTRADAVQTAMERGARLGVARADTLVASAQLIAARARPNPTLNGSYSGAVPNYHVSADFPIDLPGLRQTRIRAAELGVQASQFRFLSARATIALDADTTYTRAVAARDRLALSRRNALDADSLLHMVERRRDAGDAAEMDVALARVNAGQQENIAVGDSLTWISALLDLQGVLGMVSDRLEIRVSDSLAMPPEAAVAGQSTLAEAAAGLSLESATLSARLQHRSIWSTPSISLGFEYHDPGGQTGILPTFGLGIGVPLFDRNRGAIALAEAEQARAAAELTLARVQTRNEIAHAIRERENALSRVARDQQVVTSANLVVAMSLTAYREGAQSLPNVLQAQRTARDVLAQYIDDLANAWVATAELRVLSLAPPSSP
jgi:cobalt-zinc-cadmium efflux system outer membrane protein